MNVEQRWLRRAIAGSALPAQAKTSERRSSERRSRFTMKKSDDFGAVCEAAWRGARGLTTAVAARARGRSLLTAAVTLNENFGLRVAPQAQP